MSHYENPVIVAVFLALFYSDSMNIDPIANLEAGGERAAKTAQ